MQPIELEEGAKQDRAALVAGGLVPPQIGFVCCPVNGVQALLQAGLQSRKLAVPCCRRFVTCTQRFCLLLPSPQPVHIWYTSDAWGSWRR